ncbi:restriction endonuclease subunit S [Pseudomonas sp. Snoq117.2]|uniref:restriction endonuclease subunit S n=1 Tax=Pseudomonas sp. Snoq117.2 TaxID=1500302 RepID=UPI0008B1F794|nr:restriction endonuclease subunit S [Pseudomonas sp. Snoq117.2]SEP21759.1 type I restriction enzyme, S subunit [Pseudomonas sp. Snoq117.2]
MSETALSAIADINPGARIPKEITGSAEVSFIPMSDVSESGDWTTRQTRPLRLVAAGFSAFEEGDVLVAKITPCLENGKGAHARGLLNGIGFGSTEFHVLRAKQDVEPRFVFHITHSRRFRQAAERQMVGSAGQQRVQRQFFDEFLVRDFSQGEQRAIAQILDTLDTAIRETEALIVKLKAVKQGLLHDLLTRGIDTNGQLRAPQSEAPQLYKESPLGWIPREWEVSTVEAEFSVDSGITLGAHRAPRNYPKQYLRVANVHRARLLLEDIATLEASHAEALSRGLHPGDLLVVEGHASTEEIGRCAMAEESVRGMLFQNHLFRLRAKRFLSAFGLLWMNSAFVRAYWRCEAATSSGLNTINRTKLNRLAVAVPPLSEQERIVSVELSFASRLREEERTHEKLRREKIALMDDLLTGRVRVTPLLESVQPAAAPIIQQPVGQTGA